MKKKPTAEPIISPEIMEMAKKSVDSERPGRQERCAVCGTTIPSSTRNQENLCWVCRRLKISAWRDTDQQIPAQE
jgi:hypothetical protein